MELGGGGGGGGGGGRGLQGREGKVIGNNLGMEHKLAVNFVTSLCMTLYM